MRTRLAWILCTVTVAATTAAAQPAKLPPPAPPRPAPPKIVKDPPPAPLIGLIEQGAFAPERGFLDDVVASDDTRLGVVVTDGDAQIEIDVLGLADAGEVARIDVAPVARVGVRRFYFLGDQVFVVPEPAAEGAPITPALLGFDGKPIKTAKLKAATDIFLRTFAGQTAVIRYTLDAKARGGVLHQVEAFELMKGKKLGKKPGRLLLGKDRRDAKLDFTPHYFLDDMTLAVGTRGGVWRKSEDQRSPDTAAAWDLLTSTWVKDEPITDLLGRARVVEVMTDNPHRLFARMKEDNSTVEVWHEGVARELTLDQPLEIYTAASLAFAMHGNTLWISLQVDPVNPPAVKRKKADPEYLDLFEVDGQRAIRRARVLATKKKLRWGWVGDVLWVMEKNVGFDRGSKLITLYRPSDKR